jgi:hypothetical protein|uniref:hypothetical protein n=1 Tax=Prosthecobacter sp. TaxID=1965333 RepID=UPI0037845E56
MGLSLGMIEKMQDMGLFGTGRTRILDVGSSNLYQASMEGILSFLTKHGVKASEQISSFAAKLAKGSAYDSITGGTNESFAGELFEKAGLRYDAIDIADGYRTTILDLNHQSAPRDFVGAFDLVINYGTTEHLLNQYNAFKVIHDSTKAGGYMVHSLPCVGYSNHGYFTYTPRCMFDMAGYNLYEVVEFRFDGPGANNDLYSPVRDYSSYFPSLAQTVAEKDSTAIGRMLQDFKLPDISLFVVYRKINDKPFFGALETTTSVGRVPSSVSSQYSAQ